MNTPDRVGGFLAPLRSRTRAGELAGRISARTIEDFRSAGEACVQSGTIPSIGWWGWDVDETGSGNLPALSRAYLHRTAGGCFFGVFATDNTALVMVEKTGSVGELFGRMACEIEAYQDGDFRGYRPISVSDLEALFVRASVEKHAIQGLRAMDFEDVSVG